MEDTTYTEIRELFNLKSISVKRFRQFFDNSDYIEYTKKLFPTVEVTFENRIEIGFLFKNEMSGPPICKADGCDIQIVFKKGKYRDYCCYSCQAKQRPDEVYQKAKQTCIEKYGVDHFQKTDEYVEKVKSTSLEKFGVEHYSQTDEFMDRVKSTNLEKFGVEHPAQQVEIQTKMKKTTYNKYGVEYYSKSDKFIDDYKNTVLQKYGVYHVMHLPDIKEKIKLTNISKYGFANPMQNKDIAEIARKNHLKAHDGMWNSQTSQYRQQIKETSIEKYGVSKPQRTHYSQDYVEIFDNPELFKKFIDEHGTIEFAKLVGCNVSTIYNTAKRFNVDLPVRSYSQQELVVKQLLDDNGINYTNNDRSVISPYELDFYLPDYNLAIEINGLYWHSSRLKSNDYHFNKWNMCKKLGIDLYSIFEDDFTVNETMWKNKILHLCSKVPHQKIYARKCEVKEVDSRMQNDFLLSNHLQGKCNSTYKLGLFYNDELVSLMTFSNTRDNKNRNIDLNRFCSKIGFQVVGGAQRLLKHFISMYGKNYDTIVSFSDNSYSDGRLYRTLGFSFEYDLPPDYKYVVNGFREHKANYRKDKIKSKFGLSEDYVQARQEFVLMDEQNIFRVYDCGKKKWVLHIS